MKYLKNYQKYQTENLNEGFIVYGILVLVFNLIKFIITLNYNKFIRGFRDENLESELTNIIGENNIKIYITSNESKIRAGASINEIFIHPHLIKTMTDREIMAVILHEYYHITNKHILQKLIIDSFPVIAYMNFESWLIFLVLPQVTNLILSKTYYRKFEHNADNLAYKHGYGKDLATALNKINIDLEFEKSKLSKVEKIIYKIKKIFDVHPTIEKRIAKMVDNNPEDIKNIINNVKSPTEVKDLLKKVENGESITEAEIETIINKLELNIDGTIK